MSVDRPWAKAIVVPRRNGRAKVDRALSEFRSGHPPYRPKPEVKPYKTPSDGSTTVLIDEPKELTAAQIAYMNHFNSL